MDYHNEYFDVNVLEGAFKSPSIELTIPLPDEAFQMDNNYPIDKSWSMLTNFIEWMSGIKLSDVYLNNEYYYAVNKLNSKFNESLERFMDDKLMNLDEYLDELVYKLIDTELNMNLITSKDLPDRFKQVKEFMVKYYQAENKKNFPHYGSLVFLRACYVTVIKLLRNMFPDGIYCNKKQFNELYQQYLKNPMSIVYLPCHKSHVDYIILHIITIRFQLAIPAVVAGENLNVAVFGTILKKLGAIFIKRSFNNELYTERNLANAFEFLITNNVGIEVFIEGTRSRDGKILLPKYGILKMFQSVYKKTGKDMLMQPFSISYERIYETDGYLKELIGQDKKQESLVNILKNGYNNLLGSEEKLDVNKIIKQKLPYNNVSMRLNGKIYVKLGNRFLFSQYQDNLKQIAFKTLHDINSLNYLPEIAMIGTLIQLYLYKNPASTQFPILELYPLFRTMLRLIGPEINDDINASLMNYLSSLSEDQFIYLVKFQVIKFLKFIRVNTKTDEILVVNPIELLYYKNSTIHLLVNKSIVAFILSKSKVSSLDLIDQVNVLQSLLKNEFLFDYNENPKCEVHNILAQFIDDKLVDSNYRVLDHEIIKNLSLLVSPFIKSYTICINNINLIMHNADLEINEQVLINSNLAENFPNTKQLIKNIQKNSPKNDLESINKQYLLSCLYYLNYLELIKIFKNKARTVAFVKIQQPENLQLLLRFLSSFYVEDPKTMGSIDIRKVVDIVDKKFAPKL